MSRWQLLPPLTADEVESLRADIAAHGVTDPVEIDETGEIIDGHHRADIADVLGIDYPTVTRIGWSETQIVEHVFRKHLGRRNLTTDQRHEVVREMRTRLRWSNVRIASALGVSDETVRRDLQRISTDVEMPATVETSDGRAYPATRPADLRAAALSPADLAAEEAGRLRVAWARIGQRLTELVTYEPATYVPLLDADDRALMRSTVTAVRSWLDAIDVEMSRTSRPHSLRESA